MDLSELLEDEGKNLVIIYPGRFHPFHIGHGKVYQYLKQNYSNAKVFISTSGKTDGDRSPFTFEEKRKMMILAGVDASAIVQCKSPYQSIEIVERFDKDKTVVLFAVSEKDMATEPRFDFSTGVKLKKNGEAAHMQKWEGMESADTVRLHSYIATTPTFKFKVRGQEINSASQIRNMIASSDDTMLTQMLQDLYSIEDVPADIIEIFKRKVGNKETMNENWDEHSFSEFLKENVIEDNIMKKGILTSITEGKSPHKKGTKKYNAHMAAMHAESIDEEFDRKVAEVLDEKMTGPQPGGSHLRTWKNDSGSKYVNTRTGEVGATRTHGDSGSSSVVKYGKGSYNPEKKAGDVSATRNFSNGTSATVSTKNGGTLTTLGRPDFKNYQPKKVTSLTKTNEWVQELGGGSKWTGQEINFIQDLCKRHDGIQMQWPKPQTGADGIKGPSPLWDGGNIMSSDADLQKLMSWVEENKHDVESYFRSLFRVYSNKDSGQTQSDGNQVLDNIKSKIGGEVSEMFSTRSLGLKGASKRSRARDRDSERDECSTCRGSGWERVSSDEDERACDDCNGTGKIDESIDNDTLIQIIEANGISDLIVIDEHGKLINRDELHEVAPAVALALVRAAQLGVKYGKPVVQATAKRIGTWWKNLDRVKPQPYQKMSKADRIANYGKNNLKFSKELTQQHKQFQKNLRNGIKNEKAEQIKEWLKEDAEAEEKVSTLTKMQTVYKHNEDRNNHSQNILMLAQAFGDRGEIKAIEGLLSITKRQGYVTPEQSEVMYNSIHKKYIKELFPLNEVWPAIAAAGAAGYGLYKYGKKAGKYLAKKAGEVKDTLTGDDIDPLKNMSKSSDFNQPSSQAEIDAHVKRWLAHGENKNEGKDLNLKDILEDKSIDIMQKAMRHSIDEDDWKLGPHGTSGKRTAQMKAQAQDDSWKLTGTDAAHDLWYGKSKPKSVAKGTGKHGPTGRHTKPTTGPGDKTHLRNRAVEEEITRADYRGMDDVKTGHGEMGGQELPWRAKSKGVTSMFDLYKDAYDEFTSIKGTPEKGTGKDGPTGRHARPFSVAGDKTHLKNRAVAEGPADKSHLKKKQKAQAYSKQHTRNSEDFPHDSAEDKYQRHDSQKAAVRRTTDNRSDAKGVVAKAKTVAQQNVVNKQNKTADAKLIGTPITKSVAKGTGAPGPVGGAKAPVSKVNKPTAKPGRVKMTIKKSDLDWMKDDKKKDDFDPYVPTVKRAGKTRNDIFKGADVGHKGNWVESILHYSDAKGTPKYIEGFNAAGKGVKYDENPYEGAEKLQWSKGHNDWRAVNLSSKGEPNYGARGQFESIEENSVWDAQIRAERAADTEFSAKQIKMAFGILNDPRYKGGNYSGAVKAIEKLAKGLSKHPSVANALKRANESIEK